MLVSEILNEAITIPTDVGTSLLNAFDKWAEYIRDHLEENDTEEPSRVILKDNRKIGDKLGKILTPVVQKVVTQNKLSTFKRKDGYQGHKIRVDVNIFAKKIDTDGAVFSTWSKSLKYNDNTKYTYNNALTFNTSVNDILSSLGNNPTADNIKSFWLAILTHEITHLIQSLHSKLQSTHAKAYLRKGNLTHDDAYLMKKVEIDAYAQGTAIRVWMWANRYSDPVKAIKKVVFPLLTRGMTSIDSEEVFPTQDYNRIKQNFMKGTSDPKLKLAREQAWKRYNKKIYEKLYTYISAYKQK